MFFHRKKKKKKRPSGRCRNFDDCEDSPPVRDRSLLAFPFPLNHQKVGGGMVSCQKDPGILHVSCEYSEDSVRREAGTLKPL